MASKKPITVPEAKTAYQMKCNVPPEQFFTHGLCFSWPSPARKLSMKKMRNLIRWASVPPSKFSWHWEFIQEHCTEKRGWQVRLYTLFQWNPWCAAPVTRAEWEKGLGVRNIDVGLAPEQTVRPHYYGPLAENGDVTRNLARAALLDFLLRNDPLDETMKFTANGDAYVKVAEYLRLIFLDDYTDKWAEYQQITPDYHYSCVLNCRHNFLEGRHKGMWPAVLNEEILLQQFKCSKSNLVLDLTDLKRTESGSFQAICEAGDDIATKNAALRCYLPWFYENKDACIAFLRREGHCLTNCDLENLTTVLEVILSGPCYSASLDDGDPVMPGETTEKPDCNDQTQTVSQPLSEQDANTQAVDEITVADIQNMVSALITSRGDRKSRPSEEVFLHNAKLFFPGENMKYPWFDTGKIDEEALHDVAAAVVANVSSEETSIDKIGEQCKQITKCLLHKKKSAFALFEITHQDIITLPVPKTLTYGPGLVPYARHGATIIEANPECDAKRDCTLIAINNAVGYNIWPRVEMDETHADGIHFVHHGPMDLGDLQQHARKLLAKKFRLEPISTANLNPFSYESGTFLFWTTMQIMVGEALVEEKHTIAWDANRGILYLGIANDDPNVQIIVLRDKNDTGIDAQDNFFKFMKAKTSIKNLSIYQACEVKIWSTSLLYVAQEGAQPAVNLDPAMEPVPSSQIAKCKESKQRIKRPRVKRLIQQ
jgi:hypothetical protein